MTTQEAKRCAELLRKQLKGVRRFLVLGLDRAQPGFGDDAVLVDSDGTETLLDGVFQQGARTLKKTEYDMACRQYREDSRTAEAEDEEDEEEDLWAGLGDWPEEAAASTVTVPEGAESMVPGTKVELVYDVEGGEPRRKKWPADSYRVDGGASRGLAFHVNRTMDGITLDEYSFRVPLVCWNTGDRPIKVNGTRVSPGEKVPFRLSAQTREEQAKRDRDIANLPIWDSQAKISEIEELLLMRGCPSSEAHALAGYFWRSPLHKAEEYRLSDHAAWMEELRLEGKPRP